MALPAPFLDSRFARFAYLDFTSITQITLCQANQKHKSLKFRAIKTTLFATIAQQNLYFRIMMQRFIACFLMTFVSNGLARFGYVVLIPLLILSGRLSQSQSYQLGIAILVGYIFGSLFISFLHRYVSLESIAKISLLLICCSFLACSVESLPFAWAWVWRFVAGGQVLVL